MSPEPRPRWSDAEPEEAADMAKMPSMPRCPPPELVYASHEGGLPSELQARVSAHVERCRLCQMLQEALGDMPVDGLTVLEGDRILARVRAGMEPPAGMVRWAWWREPRPAFGVAAVLALLCVGSVLVWQFTQESVTPEPVRIARALPRVPVPSVLGLDKMAVPQPDSLLWRGTEVDDQREAQDLARALDPYERDDFAEAARRLGTVIARHPRSARAYLYLGISELFLGRYQEAVAAISTAEGLAMGDPELSSDVRWYLGLAHQRLGERDTARVLFEGLCQGRTVRSALGCAAHLELSTPPGSQAR